MSQKYDPHYDGSNDPKPEQDLNTSYEEIHINEDFDDDNEVVSYQEQSRRSKYRYFYEQPWLNNEDFF